jgi:hypothetical protein
MGVDMNGHGTWSTLNGSGAIILALVLLVIAGALVYLGTRVRRPLEFKRPGWTLGGLIVGLFVLSVYTFLVAVGAYGTALIQQHPGYVGSANDITPFTLTFAAISFFAILTLTQRGGMWTAFGSALVGAIAGPMIFELPFDLIVLWRTYPPNPAALYTPLFFFPLFLVELLSFAMLLLSPRMRLTRHALFALAGMFLVFAIWAVFGFAYPLTALPITLNVISKALAFATAVLLFVPGRAPAPGATAERQMAETPERHGAPLGQIPD